ncbi:hypothetical protein [Thioclava pacifica]|uniref:Uncharacterized protein n=1 Tax=Thioclava pacifica DSM 10166 TaxID=1353537 RepID=A0A074K086_9RHOB|nr:hypothetical protein [Thioclava pacifica]KEO55032.1 hypothetical protein TP2_16680 [Thioclava pacifica DSM 10166]
MNILGDVFKELFKMFVADLRLTIAILAGIVAVAVLLGQGVVGPVAAGLLLAAISIAVLGEAVLRETRRRRNR